MKVGDLVGAKAVRAAPPSWPIEGYIGIIVSFDDEDDPIVYWTHADDEATGRQSEYKNHICLLGSS